jgi:hypothetical protein
MRAGSYPRNMRTFRPASFHLVRLLLIGSAFAAALPALAESLTIRPGREFAADSYVHRPLAPDAAIDPRSAAYVAEIRRLIKAHYGHAEVNIDGNTPEIHIVPADQPTVTVRYRIWNRPGARFPPLQEQWMAVPLPDGFQPAHGDDHEAVVYQPSTGRMWEFWAMRKTGAKTTDSKGRTVDEWGAQWGGRMDDIGANPGHWVTNKQAGHTFGTTASGIPFLAGILTIEELRRGEVNHVLGFALPEVAAGRFSHPAQRTDGRSGNADAVPQGTIFRLPADLDLDAIAMDPFARMIARAVQRHGMILWDTSGVVGFRAENPGRRSGEGHPYWREGGILRCPPDAASRPGHPALYQCWPPGRLADFPWDKLQALAAPAGP